MNGILRALFAAALLSSFGCSGKDKKEPAAEPVRAFVAASTKDAIEEIVELYKKEGKGEVKVVAESSPKLATQIVNDAPADVFLSANEEWADHVKEKGYAHTTTPLLTNRLVIVVPKGNPGGVKTPDDLLAGVVKRVAVAGPKVPAGTYGRQSLKKLDLLDRLEKEKKLLVGDDVRVTLTYVERGESEAGIVYDTDAKISDKVEAVYTFEESAHDPIRYPLVLLQKGNDKEGARKFHEFLQSPAAAEVFRKHGFQTLPGK